MSNSSEAAALVNREYKLTAAPTREEVLETGDLVQCGPVHLLMPGRLKTSAVLFDEAEHVGLLCISEVYRQGQWIALVREGSRERVYALIKNEVPNPWIEQYGRIDNRPAAVSTYTIRFAKGWRKKLSVRLGELFPLCALFVFFLGVANVFYLKADNVQYFWYTPLLNLYGILISSYILTRFLIAPFYRAPKDCGYLPKISVIIACKNEEDSIRATIDCVYRSNYPRELLEVVAVNDGSTDNTLAEMQRAEKDHPTLSVINFETNLGKRHGMAAGARMATGEILVYIDSDSFVRPSTLRKIVQGLADPEVGAVCGHANVTNAQTNLLTKMQEVRYFVAFRVIKSAEAVFSTVSCCSGCLAAYRRSYVMEVLDTWLKQRFLGVEATFGDDRSLTNYMLRRYRVIYDYEAMCTTLVPDTYKKFLRQQLRWKKSWLRETWIASHFMWKRNPIAVFFFYLGAIFPVLAPLVVLNSLVIPLVVYGELSYVYIYGATLMATLYGLVYLAYYRNRLWVYGIAFSFFYMLVLVWQTFYAMLTVRQNHWGTR